MDRAQLQGIFVWTERRSSIASGKANCEREKAGHGAVSHGSIAGVWRQGRRPTSRSFVIEFFGIGEWREWIDTICKTMPAHDPSITPSRDMGQVAEVLRTWPDAVRSNHPSAALGPLAVNVTSSQRLDDPFWRRFTLVVLYRLGARVLLIGVGFDKCTALHFAERRAWPVRHLVREGARV